MIGNFILEVDWPTVAVPKARNFSQNRRSRCVFGINNRTPRDAQEESFRRLKARGVVTGGHRWSQTLHVTPPSTSAFDLPGTFVSPDLPGFLCMAKATQFLFFLIVSVSPPRLGTPWLREPSDHRRTERVIGDARHMGTTGAKGPVDLPGQANAA